MKHPLSPPCIFALLFTVTLLAAGCNNGGPNHTAWTPYTPATDLPRFTSETPISVRVADARQKKGASREDGREVIATGDKGSVFLPEPPHVMLERHLTKALTDAGFKVQAGAPVVVDARLRQLEVNAQEFTHWGLPSERASTLDALGAILPGPVRPTTARTVLDVVIRKHDQRLGFAYYVEKNTQNSDRDRAIVDTTISQSITQAIDEVIRTAAADINVAARLPVTDAEIAAQSGKFNEQLAQLNNLRQLVAAERSQVNADRKDLEQTKLALDRDRQNWASERRQIQANTETATKQAAALQTETARLTQMQQQLTAKEAELANLLAAAQRTAQQEAQLKQLQDETRNQTAQLTQARQALATEQSRIQDMRDQLTRQQADLDRRQRDFAKLQENLTNRSRELQTKEESTVTLTSTLTKQQQELAQKEQALKLWDQQLKDKSEAKPPAPLVQNLRPSIAIVEPQPNVSETSTPRVVVRGVLMDDRAIVRKKFTVNGREVNSTPNVQFTDGARGFRIETIPAVPDATPRSVSQVSANSQVFEKFEFTAALNKGSNTIVIEAWDEEGLGARETLTVNHNPGEGRVFIVAIGINSYSKVPKLKYAAADAKVIVQTLQKQLDVPAENIELLLDDQATLQNIKRTLGVTLKARANRQDMAIIFFSGHGAPEEDSASPDQDGIEKYLLPVDADMTSFYSTALPMKEVTEIFRRLPCERVVFIADTCYSGAVGNAEGKTVAAPGKTFRAFAIERVVNRLGGTGRVIMTASKGSEISQERDDLKHGVFSHYVIQGLSGKADRNRDRLITATELYDYVRIEVPKATANNQNPLMSKDDAVGEIVLSVVK